MEASTATVQAMAASLPEKKFSKIPHSEKRKEKKRKERLYSYP